MDDNDELPPDLVTASEGASTGVEGQTEDLSLVKVPITIVTGKLRMFDVRTVF